LSKKENGELEQRFVSENEINEIIKVVDKEEQEEKAKASQKQRDF
jgi:hypothetical protein